jgi:hypothetical protein
MIHGPELLPGAYAPEPVWTPVKERCKALEREIEMEVMSDRVHEVLKDRPVKRGLRRVCWHGSRRGGSDERVLPYFVLRRGDPATMSIS